MKSYFTMSRLAAAFAAALLPTQFSASAASPHNLAPRVAAIANPGAPPNCVSSDQFGNRNPKVHPPCSTPYGMTYGEWTAKWWQWVYSIPLESNPQLAGMPPQPDVDCSQGQSGPVWFLAAGFGGTAVRSCTVPTGVSIFFPVTNTYFGVIGFDCIHRGAFPNGYPAAFLPVSDCLANPWPHPDLGIGTQDQPNVHNYADLVKLVAAHLDDPGPIDAEIDGVSIRDLTAYRAQAPIFSVTTPSHNILGFVWPGIGPYGTGAADTYYPNGSDGYWLMLTPLTPGKHTVHFAAGAPPWLDVTYHLTVRPGH